MTSRKLFSRTDSGTDATPRADQNDHRGHAPAAAGPAGRLKGGMCRVATAQVGATRVSSSHDASGDPLRLSAYAATISNSSSKGSLERLEETPRTRGPAYFRPASRRSLLTARPMVQASPGSPDA